MAAFSGSEDILPGLELFFDLVFALTQVTGFLADHLARSGMIQGAPLLEVQSAAPWILARETTSALVLSSCDESD